VQDFSFGNADYALSPARPSSRSSESSMRVLHVESGPNWGGQEVRNVTEVQWLQEHGHSAWLACDPRSESYRRAPERGVTPVSLPFSKPGYLGSAWSLLRLCRRLQVDMIQTHSPLDAWVALPAHLLGWPVVRSRNILNPVPPNIRAFIYRHGCRRIIATAGCIKTGLVNLTKVPEVKIDVVGEGVDTCQFDGQADGAGFRAGLGIPPRAPLVGMIAMLRGEKGAIDFAKAALRCLSEMPEARFVIVGEGPQRQRIEETISTGLAKLGVGPESGPPIVLAGYRTDTPQALAAMDLVVIPSHIEARCRVLAEAMFMGRPVVASRVGGMIEVVDEGSTGLLVSPRDAAAMAQAILQLLRDPDTRARMGQRAQDKARAEMTLDGVMAQTLAVYQRAIRETRARL